MVTDDLAEQASRSFAFGPFVLLPERQLLLRGDAPVRIGSRALDILTTLVERPGELVTKRELIARVWPSTFVDEGNVKVNVAALRRALSDGGSDDARYIATVTGRGYRFTAPVTRGASSDPVVAPAAATARRHNLPIGTTRIVGRADAIDTIRRDLEASRLVTIVGPGGIGKTTVALAVAEHALGMFKDGVWLIDLALVKDPDLAANAIASVIGLPANMSDVLAGLCGSLRDREMLLVLDSCEHIVDAAASCTTRILGEAGGVKILVTSREPLLVSGERVRRLPGLATPPLSSEIGAEEALTYPAVQLFVDRATDRLETFKLSDADAPAVAEICWRLDGLALAIELAATRVDAFSVSSLLKQLDDRFHLLVGRRAAPERHRTLTATLDWSYGLLSEREAALLRMVSVFAGVFDIDGAAAVSNVARVEAAATLAELVAKSLLTVDLDGADVGYRLLETTRVYCWDALRAGGEDGAVRGRHAEHILTVLEIATTEWAQRPAGEWGATYGRVIDDLRAALGWASGDPANRSLRIRLTLAGILLWNHFSLTEECRVHVSRAVEDLEAAQLTGTAVEMKLKVWLGGATMFTRGLAPKALDAMRRALEIAERLDDTDYRLRCLRMIGIYELFTGRHEAGLLTLESFASLAAAEDPSALPESETHLGIAELFLGRLQHARQRLERLEKRDLKYVSDAHSVRYLSDRVVDVICVLSQIQWLTGSPDTAANTAAAAVALAQQSKHHLSLNNALSYACPIFYWSGNYDEGDRYVTMLNDHVTRHGFLSRRPVASFYRAALACTKSDMAVEMVEDLQRALEDFRSVNHLARMPYYLSVVADVHVRRGSYGEAETTIQTALDIARAQNEGWCLPEVLRVQAFVLTARGKTAEAEALLEKSMAVAHDVGALSWRLRSANDLAKLWSDRSRAEDARRMLSAVYSEFSEGYGTSDLVAASHLLDSLTRCAGTA